MDAYLSHFNVLALPFIASLKYKNNNESRVFQKKDTTFKANRPVDLKEVVTPAPSNHRLSGNQWEHSLCCEVNYGVAAYGRRAAYTTTTSICPCLSRISLILREPKSQRLVKVTDSHVSTPSRVSTPSSDKKKTILRAY